MLFQKNFYRKYINGAVLRRWKRKFYVLQQSRRHQPKFSWQHIVLSYVGSFIGIAVLAYLSVYSSYPLIAAPFGATAVLVFGVPDSPLAQPRCYWREFNRCIDVRDFGTFIWYSPLGHGSGGSYYN